MSSERLWAPWRAVYIQKGGEPHDADAETLRLLPEADPECFICRAVASTRDRENLVVFRGALTTTILNRYPYNNGHLLIVPNHHRGQLADLNDAEHAEIHAVLVRLTKLLPQALGTDACNIGLNLGQAAGAGVPGHLHWHFVPRWQGDANFMATVADTRVLSQSLDACWELLHAALATQDGDAARTNDAR